MATNYDTICRDCVFADFDGNKQIQCDFGRLEKFVDAGAEVVEETEKNTNKSYFRIIGRICNTCRDISTLEGVPARKWMDKVREEIRVRVAMAVYVDSDESVMEVCRSLRSVYQQTVKAHEIILIYNVDGKDAPPEYTSLLINFANAPWRIESIRGIPNPQDGSTNPNYGESIDIAVKSQQMKSTYFAACRAGWEFPADYIETIDTAINDDLNRFVALSPDEDGNGLFVQTGLHKFLQGNKQIDIIEKIKDIAQEEGTAHMIKTLEEIK